MVLKFGYQEKFEELVEKEFLHMIYSFGWA
jgi:hypothetical protein